VAELQSPANSVCWKDVPQTLDDITARHLAKVVESSDDAIVSKDLNSIIKSWNPAAERMFGYSEAEVLGKSIRILIPDHLQDEEDLVLSKIRAREKVEHYETIRRRKDGKLISVSLTVSPIYDDAGQIVGASKIARDISDRVAMEAAAAEYTANTQKLSEVGAMVASTLDRKSVVQKVTDTATQLTHAEFGAFFYNVSDEHGDSYMLYALSGLPREAFADFPHPRATGLFAPTFKGEGVVRLDDVTVDPRFGKNSPFNGMPPGHLPVKSYLAVPVKGMSGNVLGGLFFAHSQTGQFTEQHERLAVGIASWASVALETRGCIPKRRSQSREGRLLAVLSHELRTPLNAIVGYSRMMRGNMLPPDQVTRAIDVPRAQCAVADADRRRRARRVANRVRERSGWMSGRGPRRHRRQRDRHRAARSRRQGCAVAEPDRSADRSGVG
jgi:PAS domain S-box-containing protein